MTKIAESRLLHIFTPFRFIHRLLNRFSCSNIPTRCESIRLNHENIELDARDANVQAYCKKKKKNSDIVPFAKRNSLSLQELIHVQCHIQINKADLNNLEKPSMEKSRFDLIVCLGGLHLFRKRTGSSNCPTNIN